MTVEISENVSSSSPVTDIQKETPVNTTNQPAKKEASPAQELRDIQMLLVQGIYPGQVAPQVVKSYQLLEKMAQAVEAQAAAPQEVK